MDSSEIDGLLDLVKGLHGELDRYLTDAASCADAIPRILDLCAQMRTGELSEAAKYWLGAIERHATEIASPRCGPGLEGHLLTSSVFLGTQLLKDIYFLRTGLVSARDSMH